MRGTVNTFYGGSIPLNVFINKIFKGNKNLDLYLKFKIFIEVRISLNSIFGS